MNGISALLKGPQGALSSPDTLSYLQAQTLAASFFGPPMFYTFSSPWNIMGPSRPPLKSHPLLWTSACHLSATDSPSTHFGVWLPLPRSSLAGIGSGS